MRSVSQIRAPGRRCAGPRARLDGLGRLLADGVGVRALQAPELAFDQGVKDEPSAWSDLREHPGLQFHGGRWGWSPPSRCGAPAHVFAVAAMHHGRPTPPVDTGSLPLPAIACMRACQPSSAQCGSGTGAPAPGSEACQGFFQVFLAREHGAEMLQRAWAWSRVAALDNLGHHGRGGHADGATLAR